MNTNLHELEMRTVYTGKLAELAAANPDIVVLDADLSKASGTNPAFCTAFPDRFINCGVAEADMIGIAAGLAVEGRIPFCATFTPFASRRVYDQLTISVAYANTNVKIVGTAPGITAGSNGGTHMCFQDLAIMRVMPKFAARAAQELAEEGLAVDLLNCPCIKPFDAESLTASAERTGAVVTVEN